MAESHGALKQLNEKNCTECPLLGKQVGVTGTTRKGLNGKTGVATAFDQVHGRGRYVVAFEKQEERKRRSGQASTQARCHESC